MANKYIPTPVDWVRKHVELYEGSGGTEGATLMDTGLRCVLVTHTGNKTGATRKTPLMRVKDGNNFVLVGSLGGAVNNPVWVYNLRHSGTIEIRDETEVFKMQAREVIDDAEREKLWATAVEAFPTYAEYQEKTSRKIPVFLAEPI